MVAEAASQPAQMENISAGGVLLQVDTDMEIGATVNFTIRMPAAVLGAPRDVRVNCTGRVVRCHEMGERHAVAVVIDEYQFERE